MADQGGIPLGETSQGQGGAQQPPQQPPQQPVAQQQPPAYPPPGQQPPPGQAYPPPGQQPQGYPPPGQQPQGYYPPPGQQPQGYAQPGAPYPGQPAHVGGPPPYAGQPQQRPGVYPPAPPGPQPAAQQQVQWMAAPTDVPSGCPPGLEYLTNIDQLLVHQQIEIFELITNFETQNKYRVRNTLGQQVYFAAEESSVFQRQCCGPGREFQMSITDNNNKEVIRLSRPLRCYYNCSGITCYCCCSCCAPHVIEVQAPPGNVVGYVRQSPAGIIRPWFNIENADGETVLKIKGPVLGCACYADANFEVLSTDGETNVGRISKQWGGLAREYFTDADNFGIQFPMDLDVKMKAVMLGAVFLIDFMFFETAGNGNRNRHHRHHY